MATTFGFGLSVLEMNGAKIWMVIISVPAAIEPRIRISIVDPVVLFFGIEPPFDIEFRLFRASRWIDSRGINLCSQEFLADAIRFEIDRSHFRLSLENIFQPLIFIKQEIPPFTVVADSNAEY